MVDTHVKRISRKLGLTKEEDPEKIEYALMKVLPKDHWILWNIPVSYTHLDVYKRQHIGYLIFGLSLLALLTFVFTFCK